MPNNSQQWQWGLGSTGAGKSNGGHNKKYESAAAKQRAYNERRRIRLARQGLGRLKRRPMPAWQRMRRMRGQHVARPYQIHLTSRQMSHWLAVNTF